MLSIMRNSVFKVGLGQDEYEFVSNGGLEVSLVKLLNQRNFQNVLWAKI